MEHSAESVARMFLKGRYDDALDACVSDSGLAARAAERIGTLLAAGAREQNVPLRPPTWIDHQGAILRLARVDGVDQARLAESMVDAVTWERVFGVGSPLDPETFAWLMTWAPEAVYDAAGDSDYDSSRPIGARFLSYGLWTHPGARAREWMLARVRREETAARFRFEDMCIGRMRSVWSPGEWALRLHMLADAKLDGLTSWAIPHPPAPRESAVAQVHFACTYAPEVSHGVARSAIDNLRAYRSGVPEDDAELFWWDVTDVQAELLRQLIELSGEPRQREPLVSHAVATGMVRPDLEQFLSAPVPRPAWVDGDVSWELDAVYDAGHVDLPEGALSGTDPFGEPGPPPYVVALDPGRYRVRVVTAIHALMHRECAAAEVLVDPEAAVSRWEPVELLRPEEGGYMTEVGSACFGAVGALPRPESEIFFVGEVLETDEPYPIGSCARFGQIDVQEHGSVVAFTVGPQHQVCRTWVGRGSDGRVARVVTDLGLFGLDLEADPALPWETDGWTGRPQKRARKRVPEERRRIVPAWGGCGIARGDVWRPAAGAEADRTVTVLEVLATEQCWLGSTSIWYRWDESRIGELAAIDEFFERFKLVG